MLHTKIQIHFKTVPIGTKPKLSGIMWRKIALDTFKIGGIISLLLTFNKQKKMKWQKILIKCKSVKVLIEHRYGVKFSILNSLSDYVGPR